MHELSITESILNTALSEAKRNNASRVVKISLTMGELSSVVPECVQEYFDLISEDTIAYKALLVFNTVPAMIHCSACGTDSHIRHYRLMCPACQSQQIQIISGQEFYIDNIEIESED